MRHFPNTVIAALTLFLVSGLSRAAAKANQVGGGCSLDSHQTV